MLQFLLGQAAASVAVLFLAGAICLLLRRGSAALRHFVWLLAFASLLAIPICAILLAPLAPDWQNSTPNSIVVVTMGGAIPLAPDSSLPPPTIPIPWGGIAAGVWVAGAAIFLIRIAGGMYLCAARRRRAALLDSRIARDISLQLNLNVPVDVRVSDDVAIPETFGLRRAAVLLPAVAREWTAERLRIVLLHELVHVQRNDWAVHIVGRVAVALFWFNPLSWYALRRMYDERELACDDGVIRYGIAQSDYARQLVEIARSVRVNPASMAVAMARPGHLEGRIRSILNPQSNRRNLTLKHRIFTLVPAVLLISAASLVTAPAQSGNASITGTVKDPSGATVPRAEVILSGGKGREVVQTDDTGQFAFSGFPDGKYSLKVLKPGFRMFEKSGIAITAAAPVQMPVVLGIGRISERVTVTAQGRAQPQPPMPSTALQPATAAPPASAPAKSTSVQTENGGAGPKRIRVGGNIHAAKLVNNVQPKYPQHLIAQGVEGTVILEAVIGLQGQVLSLQPVNSQVHPDLVQAATEAVNQWLYQPTLLNGNPVEIATTITVDFKLQP